MHNASLVDKPLMHSRELQVLCNQKSNKKWCNKGENETANMKQYLSGKASQVDPAHLGLQK
jgi:hypothetical protein